MELLAFVVLACEREHWGGELVLYVTDNANVRSSWLYKRRLRNRIASLLVRLVQRLEAEKNVLVHPIYIRTYRNQLADWLSREDLQQARKELERLGWVSTGCQIQWEVFLQDATRHSLVMPVTEDPAAVAARRLPQLTSCGLALSKMRRDPTCWSSCTGTTGGGD